MAQASIKQKTQSTEEEPSNGFECVKIFHQADIGNGNSVRICQVKSFDKLKLEIRLFRDSDGEPKPTRNKICFHWSDKHIHEESLAYLIAELINGAEAMGITLDDYIDVKPST